MGLSYKVKIEETLVKGATNFFALFLCKPFVPTLGTNRLLSTSSSSSQLFIVFYCDNYKS